MFLLAINCGSSSIKGRLFALPKSTSEQLTSAAQISVSNIGSRGDRVKIKISWEAGRGKDVLEDGQDGGEIEYESLFPFLLERIAGSSGVERSQIKYITHRIVHGGTHKSGLKVTHGHEEALSEMDNLSEFAPLHNHHAVLGVKACLKALPDHTSLLLFDTLFHQTIPPEVYTYALPPPDEVTVMPLRKYGFHGLSYASIVDSIATHLNKPTKDVNLVVAHLGSGASSCCIKGGKSIDTSMGLTPLEGLIGGTRTGTIDPTAIFHHTKDCTADAGLKGFKVTKAELVMNKKSGLSALAGTTNFAVVAKHAKDPSSCTPEEHQRAALAYAVFLDRIMGYLSQYLAKLLATTPLEHIDGIVFSGGIGENASDLRRDALERFTWLGATVDKEKNEGKRAGVVTEITTKGSKLKGWVVETDEEGWCAHLAREHLGI